MAKQLGAARGHALDFSCDADCELLLSHLYQKLVRYGETNVRYAVRLDHFDDDDGTDAGLHPLMRSLAGPPSDDPIHAAIAADDEATAEQRLRGHGSAAAAYVELLRRYDNRMRDVAEFLLISISHCYRCYGRVLRQAGVQSPMTGWRTGATLALRPWRAYRLQRPWEQLALTFATRRDLLDDEPIPPAGPSRLAGK